MTVSNSINNKKRVSSKTKRRVKNG
ncbi:MAG: LacI family DNA-binding transcriptional regulator [Agathobacter sp.]|nr:LacI family DNA-binding transcriptional regulator [Agathobacter sp.]